MTQFLDLRIQPVGGGLATAVSINQGTSISNYAGLSLSDLLDSIQGRHVLIASHGFNVNRGDGIDCLSNWNRRHIAGDSALREPVPIPDARLALRHSSGPSFPVVPEILPPSRSSSRL